jgi:hypothetical protein
VKEVGDSGKVIGINQIKNVYDATGVSLSTLKLILKVYTHNNEWGKISAHLTKDGQEGKLKLM